MMRWPTRTRQAAKALDAIADRLSVQRSSLVGEPLGLDGAAGQAGLGCVQVEGPLALGVTAVADDDDAGVVAALMCTAYGTACGRRVLDAGQVAA